MRHQRTGGDDDAGDDVEPGIEHEKHGPDGRETNAGQFAHFKRPQESPSIEDLAIPRLPSLPNGDNFG